MKKAQKADSSKKWSFADSNRNITEEE